MATQRNINISELLRDALTLALGSVSGKLPMSRAKSRIKGVPVVLKNKAMRTLENKLNVEPDAVPRVAEFMAKRFNGQWGTELEPQDLIDLIPRC